MVFSIVTMSNVLRIVSESVLFKANGKLAFTAIIVIASLKCYPQTIAESVHIASPTASSLGKFVDIPVGYHTGTPNIDIPIYTVKDGPLELPISLSYHASGLKVMEQASWVGAGWAMKGPGVVSRTTRGNPDDIAASDSYYLKDQGYFSYLFVEGLTPPTFAYSEFAGGNRDGEADIFFFSCGDYSGSFSFRADKTLDVVPQQEVDIKPVFCSGSGCNSNPTNGILDGWIITTPDGIKYYYGKTVDDASDVDPMESVQPYSTATGLTYSKEVSSWYLYKIESPDKLNTVTLRYAKENYGFYTIAMFPVPNTGYAPTGSDGINLVKNTVNGVRLESIQFTGGTVTFVPDADLRQDLCSDVGGLSDLDQSPLSTTAAKALKQIRIQGTNLDKLFEFSYGYFEDNVNPLRGTFGVSSGLETTYTIHTDKKRLKLLSLQERSFDGTVVIPAHVFSYYDESSVPRTLSLAQDHWGYFNGATGNTKLIPPISVDGGNTYDQGGNANREAAWPAMRAGALKSIRYPTGGRTDFEFEAHENGYIREWYTYEQPQTPFFDGSGGMDGGHASSEPKQVTFQGASGKYFLDLIGSNALPQSSGGTLYIGSNIYYGISQGIDVTNFLVDIPSGTYNVQVTANSPFATGKGVMAKIYSAIRTRHTESPLIGGLRIKTMTFVHDGPAVIPNVVQTFEYKDGNGTSQGVLYSRPYHVLAIRNDRIMASGIPVGTGAGAIEGHPSPQGCLFSPSDGYFMSPGSVLPMRTSQGSHIGYNWVKVIQADGSYTTYSYKPGQNEAGDVSVTAINKSVCSVFSPNFPPAPLPHDFSRGELRRVAVYSPSGTILKESNFLTDYQPELVGVHGLIVRNYSSTSMLATEYELKSAKKKKSYSLTWNYGQTPSGAPTGVLTETFFESASHTLPTRVVTKEVTAPNTSQTDIASVIPGKVLSEVRNKYVADIIIISPADCAGSSAAETNLLSTMTSLANSYSLYIAGCTNFNCTFTRYLQYQQQINDARKSYVTERVDAQSAYTSCMTRTSVYSAAGTELKAIIDLKNRNEITGLLESSNWRDGLFMSSTFTTYQQFDSNPLYIYPGKTETVRVNTPQPSTYFNPLTNSSIALVKDAKYSQDATFKFKTGNLVEVTGRNGLVTSYLWRDKLPIAKAIGVSFNTLSAAYTAAGNDLVLLRSQPSLLNSQLSTFTYDPLVGMTSSTDPNGIRVKYVYDALGRLDYMKDKDENIVQKTEYRYKQ